MKKKAPILPCASCNDCWASALGLVASEVFNQNIRSFREKRESLGFIRRKRNKIKNRQQKSWLLPFDKEATNFF